MKPNISNDWLRELRRILSPSIFSDDSIAERTKLHNDHARNLATI